MERLNDIVNRSAMRRAQRAEQRADLEKSLQEGRLPQQKFTQRPQIEQPTNPAPRESYASQPPYTHKTPGSRRISSSSARPELTQAEQPVQRTPRQYGASTQRSPLSPQRLADYGASTYSKSEQGEQSTRRTQEPGYPLPSHALYYHTDDAIPVIESDVQHEELYEEVEEEEEHPQQRIYYTTWEDQYDDRKRYSHPGPRVVADALTAYEAHTYEPPVVGPASAHIDSQDTRNLRNIRPSSLSADLPASVQHTREPHLSEITVSGKITQPLRPRYDINTGATRTTDGKITQPLHPRYDISTGATRTTENVREIPHQERTSNRQLVSRDPIHIQPNPPAPGIFISPMTKPACPKCRGAGYLRANVPYGHPNFGKPVACECKEAERKAKRRTQLREMSNMDAFHDSTFNTFNTRVPGVKEAYEAARRYAERIDDSWLVFIGPNGCGKTHLAAAIANQCLESGAVVLFSVVPDLLDHLRAAFAPTATEVYDQLFSKMREAEVLILDDLGAQQSSPWANEKLFQLLNYRYNERLPTVITANPKGMQGMDERIRSRLGDIGLAETIHFNYAQDYRPKRGR